MFAMKRVLSSVAFFWLTVVVFLFLSGSMLKYASPWNIHGYYWAISRDVLFVFGCIILIFVIEKNLSQPKVYQFAFYYMAIFALLFCVGWVIMHYTPLSEIKASLPLRYFRQSLDTMNLYNALSLFHLIYFVSLQARKRSD